MLFAENEINEIGLLQALVVLLGGGGAGVFGKYLYDVWRQRRADWKADAEQAREWRKEDDNLVITGLQRLVEGLRNDVTGLKGEMRSQEADCDQRIRQIESLLSEERHRGIKYLRRLYKLEAACHQAGIKVDDSLDDLPPVSPHGPDAPRGDKP